MTSVRAVITFLRVHVAATILSVVVVFLLAGAWFLFDRRAHEDVGGPEPVAEELVALIARAAKHALFPGGEEPAVMMVVDLAPLRSQKFFERASVGDALLVFRNAKLVILYNPLQDRVVNIAPLVEAGIPGDSYAFQGVRSATSSSPSP